MAHTVFSGVGHGGSDRGATANGLDESSINLVMAKACNEVLVAHGVNNPMSRTKDENDPLSDEIAEANRSGAKFAVDFHNNAGGGDGCEIFFSRYRGLGEVLARNIEVEMVKIGQNSRGIKTKLGADARDYYGFIRETTMPAVIVEAFFLDSNDRFIADTIEEQKRFGVAIAKGILKTLDIKYQASKPTVDMHRNIIVYNTGAEADRHSAEFFSMILNANNEDCIVRDYQEYKKLLVDGKSIFAVGGGLLGKFKYHKIFVGKDRNETAKSMLAHLKKY